MHSIPALDRVWSTPAHSPDVGESGGPGRVLQSVFETLERAGIRYCVTHGYESYPERIRSDVDCIISADVRPGQLVALLQENRAPIGAEVVRCRGHNLVLAGKNADGSPFFLHLDISVDYELGDHLFYAGSELLESRRRFNQFWVPAVSLEFGCYAVRKIVKGDLSDEQARRLSNLYQQDPAGCRRQVTRFWGADSAALIASAAGAGDWGTVRANLCQLGAEARRRARTGRPFRVFRNWLWRIGGLAKRCLWPDRGLNVVFLGPDGAGKSSVIQAVRQQLAGAFARTTCLSFPPALLGRVFRRPQVPDTTPHDSPPRSFLASTLRAVCYWLVYSTLGYYATVHLALARSTLVLHDRHLVDALVDPRRYRYAGPRWLLRFIWRVIPKPDLVILLDAPAEVLQARKQEVPFAETTRQREAYRALTATMKNGHIVNVARPLELVVREVNDIVLRHLTTRLVRRLRLSSLPEVQRGRE
jgi:thymidylate kinase